jgi:hypothetical protein
VTRTPAGGAGGRGRRAWGPAALRWRSQGPTGGAGGRGVQRNGAVGRFPAAGIRGSRGRDGSAGTGKLDADGGIGGAAKEARATGAALMDSVVLVHLCGFRGRRKRIRKEREKEKEEIK